MRQLDVDIGRMMKPSLAGRSTLTRVRRVSAVIPGRADGEGLEAAQLDATVAAIARTHFSLKGAQTRA
jgi:hypothetical protein